MICRRCGAEIPDNSMRCKKCGLKVNMYCPACHTLNLFGEKHCVNCGTELLLSCSVCGSTNIYYASECRKCHSPLIRENKSLTKLKPQKDIQVVESFSVDESAYSLKEGTRQLKVTKDIDDNTLPTLEKIRLTYNED